MTKNFLTLFATITLIVTTAINVSIHQKQSQVLGQTTSFCQKIGGTCTSSCKASTTLRCLAGRALGCTTTYCSLPTTKNTIQATTPILPTPTTFIQPTVTPTRTPPTYAPTPTGVGTTLGFVPCSEIERIYTYYCQTTYPTSTPRPTTPTPTPSPRPITPTQASCSGLNLPCDYLMTCCQGLYCGPYGKCLAYPTTAPTSTLTPTPTARVSPTSTPRPSYYPTSTPAAP